MTCGICGKKFKKWCNYGYCKDCYQDCLDNLERASKIYEKHFAFDRIEQLGGEVRF